MVAASIFAKLAAAATAVRDDQNHVRTLELLDVCRELLPVLGRSPHIPVQFLFLWACSMVPLTAALCADKFGTSFLIVRSDVGGNINRLAERQAQDPVRYKIVDGIIDEEVARQDLGSSSCTKGLLWLKR